MMELENRLSKITRADLIELRDRLSENTTRWADAERKVLWQVLKQALAKEPESSDWKRLFRCGDSYSSGFYLFLDDILIGRLDYDTLSFPNGTVTFTPINDIPMPQIKGYNC